MAAAVPAYVSLSFYASGVLRSPSSSFDAILHCTDRSPTLGSAPSSLDAIADRTWTLDDLSGQWRREQTSERDDCEVSDVRHRGTPDEQTPAVMHVGDLPWHADHIRVTPWYLVTSRERVTDYIALTVHDQRGNPSTV